MLRAPLTRSRLATARPTIGLATSQWQMSRPRFFADGRRSDQIVLPGTESDLAAQRVLPPKLPTAPGEPVAPSPAQPIVPPLPPKPEEVKANIPPPTKPAPPPVVSAPPPPPPPPPRRGRIRTFLTLLVLLGSAGYAGGVYYSLISDNFHDFFTEYVPGGEDAVAYFEEREFRRRFPQRPAEVKQYPQIRGEGKVNVPRQSGVSARTSTPEKKDDKKSGEVKSKAAADAVKAEKKEAPKEAPKPAEAKPAPAALIDHVAVPNAAEPVVQDAVKLVNDIITAINNDPNATKYHGTLEQAKSQLSSILQNISLLKSQIQHDADEKVKSAHSDFDTAAKELVARLEREIQDQELKWREEFETEREKIATSYESRLKAELESAQKLAEEQTKTSLVEQQIALQRAFGRQVRDRVESERSGRLGKLDALSSSVEELERLTADWNSVISNNLATQHLHVALASVRSALASDVPTPFVTELSALKELAASNPVVDAAIASIPPQAYQRGLPSSAALIDRFRRVASEVRKAALLPEDAGVASHAASAVLSKFMFAKKTEGTAQGSDVEAVLARAEASLEEGDLDSAAREMNGLHGWAGVLSRDWVGECRRVLETKQALEVIATEARLQSLLVD